MGFEQGPMRSRLPGSAPRGAAATRDRQITDRASGKAGAGQDGRSDRRPPRRVPILTVKEPSEWGRRLTLGRKRLVVFRLPETDTEQVVDLPAELAAVQVEDDGTVMTRMGRGAVRKGVQVAAGALDVPAIGIVCTTAFAGQGLKVRGPSPALRAT